MIMFMQVRETLNMIRQSQVDKEWLCNLSELVFKGLISGNEGGDEELAGRLKDWVGSRLSDVSVKDEHKVIYRTTFNI